MVKTLSTLSAFPLIICVNETLACSPWISALSHFFSNPNPPSPRTYRKSYPRIPRLFHQTLKERQQHPDRLSITAKSINHPLDDILPFRHLYSEIRER